MSDTTFDKFVHYGTAAQRAAFTPSPSGGIQPLYIWRETDTGLEWVYDTAWHLRGFALGGVTAPVDGDFAWVNQGGASVAATTDGGIYLLAPTNSGDSLRIRKKAAPATPYTITAGFLAAPIALNSQHVGLCFRESGTGKLQSFHIAGHTNAGSANTPSEIGAIKWTNPTTYSADYQVRGFNRGGPVVWLRIADDGVNRICSWSPDGSHFITFHSVGRTDFLTADEVGFFANEATNAYALGLTLLSWKQA